MAKEADILKALENLYGPGGAPLVAAVSGINVSGAKAFVSLAGDPAQAQVWEAARKSAETAIRAVSGVEQAIVTLTADRASSVQPQQRAHGHDRHGHSHSHATPAAP